MKRVIGYFRGEGRVTGWAVLAAVGLIWLMLYKLGSLTGGLSAGETSAATTPVGWHGIYHQAFYLPLNIVRSVDFALFRQHGQTLTRLPNTLFGIVAIVSFIWLIKLWHSWRTAILAGLLFATGAWVLHVSRLASFDVLYLCAAPVLLLTNSLLQRYAERRLVWYGSLVIWGLALYVPGLVWLVVLNLYLQREALSKGWAYFEIWWERALYVFLGLVWLPLLAVNLARRGNLATWLGWPSHLAVLGHLPKQFVGVPEYPTLWLGRAPLLDIFTLAVCIIGLYFYARHWQASRSRLLGAYALIGWVLVGLGGPVSLSLLVPLLYVGAAAGIAYLLHEWMHTFPQNPLARGLGLSLLVLAVCLACVYNLRAYFVAWPHAPVTRTVFNYRR